MSGGGWGGWKGWGEVVEKILHSDLKISLDETDRDKFQRLGLERVPRPVFRELEGNSSSSSSGASVAGVRRREQPDGESPSGRRTPLKTRHGAPHPR